MKQDLIIEIHKDESDDTTCIIDLIGQITLSNINNFNQSIDRLINTGIKNIVFNCEELEYVSSIVLSKFYVIKEILENLDGKVLFYRVNNSIKEAFETIGFYDLFNITDNQEEAINIIKKDKTL